MIEIKTIVKSNSELFDAVVNDHLADGWRLLGDPDHDACVVGGERSRLIQFTHIQTLIKGDYPDEGSMDGEGKQE